ncbi:glycosyltransferase family 2 protein [Desulfatirhabdium butyrativorans]|uniref:glycosyltransferase family 2 protein n=1 Tax=Desulfatirhabdium butyrativorans TaxID=340467 RepID=UPI00146FACD7|nr:glycosyltransferase family 2 protein [Desulfatirhabdium butyrativorans]
MKEPAWPLSIVIPNWNGMGVLPACLASIDAQNAGDLQVIVVDNGSQDGSLEWVRGHYPQVQLIVHERNLGFGPAVNAGIRACDAPLVFLLNNDTELCEHCIARLMKAAADHPEYHSFAPKMIADADRSVLDGAGDGMMRTGAGYRIGTGERDGGRFDTCRPVFGPCAGAALYRRELFDRIGLFDEAYFAYLEDVDLNFRANLAGYRCLYVPDARLYHIGSRSSDGKMGDTVVRLTTRNLIRMIIKNYSIPMLFSWWPLILGYQLWWLLVCLRREKMCAYRQGLRDAKKHCRDMVASRKAPCAGSPEEKRMREVIRASEAEIFHSVVRRRADAGKSTGMLKAFGRMMGYPEMAP